MASCAEIIERFASLNVWKQGGRRAPHKPLLVLYALGRWQNRERQVTYCQVDQDVGLLLRDFGPPNPTSPSYPFRHLESDGVWRVEAPDEVLRRGTSRPPLVSELKRLDAPAGFTTEVQQALDAEPGCVARIARSLLETHFPESLHDEILLATGLDLDLEFGVSKRRKRDATFRPRILKAYEWRCCVCGFDARLGTASIALDAAHIRWHQAQGPDEEPNGLALCTLHHKTFDFGAFTISPELRVQISDDLVGSARAEELLHAFHDQAIRSPQRPEYEPDPQHLEWHRREVFKGHPRHSA